MSDLETRPRLLDLFCGAGGAARGYQLAGFHVTGVDLAPQPRYAGDAFIQGDALEYCHAHGHEYDVIHASPPCQQYSVSTAPLRNAGKAYPDLVAATRDALLETAKHYVIENVVGAPLRAPAMLCGTMFGLRVYRHRLFESSITLFAPGHGKHKWPTTSHVRPRKANYLAGTHFVCVFGNIGGGYAGSAMGIDWMTGRELSQAIPPAYTEWIGRQLLRVLALETEEAS